MVIADNKGHPIVEIGEGSQVFLDIPLSFARVSDDLCFNTSEPEFSLACEM